MCELYKEGRAKLESGDYSGAKSVFGEMVGETTVYGDEMDFESSGFLLSSAYLSLATAAEMVNTQEQSQVAAPEMKKAYLFVSSLQEVVEAAAKEHSVFRIAVDFWITQEESDELCKTYKDIRDKYFHEDEE